MSLQYLQVSILFVSSALHERDHEKEIGDAAGKHPRSDACFLSEAAWFAWLGGGNRTHG